MNLNNIKSSRSYLYEGLTLVETDTVKLWETAGSRLFEAELTADQIQTLFANIEQSATGAGGNRTFLGKGKDAAESINRAWEDLKTKIQNSGPIKNLDAQYDSAAEKLKQATGGDQGVMKYVQKYRDFAKKHPVAQTFIYSALIAAAGISGAGVGGAAALGLFKMVDKLLQGDKFSSAAYSGAKTGAAAYGASKVADYFKGGSEAGATTSPQDSYDSAANAVAATKKAAEKEALDAIKSRIANGDIAPGDNSAIRDLAYEIISDSGLNPQTVESSVERVITRAMSKTSTNESVNLSESQLDLLINRVVKQQQKLDEGVMDTLKGAAGKAADWVKTKGKNLTTKITADKLMQAWKKAGSPTDSIEIADILKKSGVNGDIVAKAFAAMKIPAPQVQRSEPEWDQSYDDEEENAPQQATPQRPAQVTDPKQIIAQIQADIKLLDSTRRDRLIAYLQKQVGAVQ